MSKKRRYTWVYNQEDTYERGPILLQHYGDPGFRTIVLREGELEKLMSWQFCRLMNDAYEAGREHAMEDLRRFIGVKD